MQCQQEPSAVGGLVGGDVICSVSNVRGGVEKGFSDSVCDLDGESVVGTVFGPSVIANNTAQIECFKEVTGVERRDVGG